MRKTILFLWAFLPMFLFAESISLDEAREIAENFFRHQASRGSSVALRMVYDGETSGSRSKGAAPALYVFDCINQPGFVVVSGDDAAYPVLGYSYDSDFPEGRLPSNVESWLQGMKGQINELRRLGAAPMAGASRAADVGNIEVQLETPQWDQGEPYNGQTPLLDGKRTYTGCAITATAIVMRYLKWPEERTEEIPEYQTADNKQDVPARPGGVTYDWDNMPLTYKKGEYTDAQAAAVSQLMADVGAMLKANYRASDTGASPSEIVPMLVKYMDYDGSAALRLRSQFTGEDWYQLLRDELNNNRPIIYSGYKNNSQGEAEGGHSFVLDGYTDADYFGVNWGWSGSWNGWFKLDAMSPDGSGTGGNGSHYNDNQNAIVGLKRDEGGQGSFWLGFGTKGFTNKPTNVRTNVPFTVEMDGFYNWGNAVFNGKICYALTDVEGVIKEELSVWYNGEIGANLGWASLNHTLTITKTIDVGDRIRVFCQPTGETEWTVVKAGEGCTWELLVGDEYTIDETTTLEYDRITRKLKVQVKDGVSVSLLTSDGESLTANVNKVGNTAAIQTEGLTKGTYILKLSKGNENRELKIQLGAAQSN